MLRALRLGALGLLVVGQVVDRVLRVVQQIAGLVLRLAPLLLRLALCLLGLALESVVHDVLLRSLSRHLAYPKRPLATQRRGGVSAEVSERCPGRGPGPR